VGVYCCGIKFLQIDGKFMKENLQKFVPCGLSEIHIHEKFVPAKRKKSENSSENFMPHSSC